MGDLILGIDVGTTAIKAAVFSLEAPRRPVAVGRADSDTFSVAPGFSERDPIRLLEQIGRCVQDAVRGLDASRIVALGVSGTACGAWLVRNGNPVRPAILWNDGRAAEIVSEWSDTGLMARIFAISGNVPFPGYTVPIVRWLLDNERESLESADTLLFCKDWVRLWLTGVVGSEETDASYAPFDIQRRTWSREVFEIAGIDAFADRFPDLLDPERTDPLLTEVVGDLGLPAGVPVSVGATDIVAGCVGGGALEPGHAVSILGTSANSSIVTSRPEFEPNEIGIMAAAPLGRWIRTMLNTSGSMTLDWAARHLSGGDLSKLLEMAKNADTADLPVLLPYLAGAGVVSPFVDAKARGAFLGLRVNHGPNELARAAVEGLAFAVADSYRSMPTDVVEITAIGGAARSDLLLQTIADACGTRVVRPMGEEFGARGVALSAAHSAGVVSSAELQALVRDLEVACEFHPRAGRVEERLSRYRACSAATRELGRLW